MDNQTRNLNPHREAVLAMIVWSEEYSKQCYGCMDFWDRLDDNKKQLCQEWCTKLWKAQRK